MPEETVATPPAPPPSTDVPNPDKPPQFRAPQSIDPTRGNKYREAMARRQKGEAAPPPAEPPSTEKAVAPSEPGKPPPAETAPAKEPVPEPIPVPVPASEKPSSALDVALGGDAPPPAEAPKDELAEFDKIESPKSEDWKRARESMRKQRDRIQELEKAPPKVDGEVETIRKENESLKGRIETLNTNLKAINAEYSEEFQSLVGNRDKALNKIASKMKYAGSERSEDLVAALNMPDGRLKTAAVKEAMSELDPDDKIAVRSLIERLDEADEKITEFRKDLPAQWDRLNGERQNQEREQFEQQMKGLESEFYKIVNELPKEIVRMRAVPEDVTNAKEWNQPIKEAIEGTLLALKPNGGTDFKQTVTGFLKGKLYDKLWDDYVAQNKELREANKRLQEYDGAGPDFRGQKKPTQEAPLTPGQRYRQALAARQGVGSGP